MLTREHVLEQALALQPSDQAHVADMLEKNLKASQYVPPEIAEVWSHELDRRIASYGRGEASAVDFDQALDHLRQASVKHRGRQVAP